MGCFKLTLLVRTSGGVADKTPWEKREKKGKKQWRKEKRSKVKETLLKEGEERGGDDIMGFDDPFFQHDITTATAVSLVAETAAALDILCVLLCLSRSPRKQREAN